MKFYSTEIMTVVKDDLTDKLEEMNITVEEETSFEKGLIDLSQITFMFEDVSKGVINIEFNSGRCIYIKDTLDNLKKQLNAE